MAGFIQKVHEIPEVGAKLCCDPYEKRTDILILDGETASNTPDPNIWQLYAPSTAPRSFGIIGFGVCCPAQTLTIVFRLYVDVPNGSQYSYSFFNDSYVFYELGIGAVNEHVHSYSFANLRQSTLPDSSTPIVNPCGIPVRVQAEYYGIFDSTGFPIGGATCTVEILIT